MKKILIIIGLFIFIGIYSQEQEILNVNVPNPGSTTNLKEVRRVINHNDSILFARTDTAQELVARTIYVSMPTDPQTPGCDTCILSDGSALYPFATITKALSTIKKYTICNRITIQLDSGLFNFTINDKLQIIRLNQTSNTQYIQGIIE